MTNDHKILDGIQKGNPESFDLLFESHYNNLCNYVASIIKNNDASEDIIQELLANIWVNRKKISIQHSISSYLYRSAYNASLDYLKHQKIKNQFQSESSRQQAISYDESLEFKEFMESLQNNIEQLPDQCKIIFKLSRFENLKYREIAQKLSISENTVDTQIRRALKKLRENLKDYFIALLLLLEIF